MPPVARLTERKPPYFTHFSHTNRLCVRLLSLLLLDLQEKRAVDVRQDTTKGNGRANESIQLLVTSDGKLQVARRDTLDLEILGGVACELQNFGGQVFEDGGNVDSCLGADPHLVLGLRLEETLHTTAGKLCGEKSAGAR